MASDLGRDHLADISSVAHSISGLNGLTDGFLPWQRVQMVFGLWLGVSLSFVDPAFRQARNQGDNWDSLKR